MAKKAKKQTTKTQKLLNSRKFNVLVFVGVFALLGGIYLLRQSSASPYVRNPNAASCNSVAAYPSSNYAGEKSWDVYVDSTRNQSNQADLRYKIVSKKQGRSSRTTLSTRSTSSKVNLGAGAGVYEITASVTDNRLRSTHECPVITKTVTRPATCVRLIGGENGPGSKVWDFSLGYNKNDVKRENLRFKYVVKRGSEVILDDLTSSETRRITFPGPGSYTIKATVSDSLGTNRRQISQATCSYSRAITFRP